MGTSIRQERIFWKGNTRNFTFDVFVSRLQGAYHDLAEYGDFRTDESKVDTLITKVSGTTQYLLRAHLLETTRNYQVTL